VQTVYPLSENTGLALTTAKYYTPSGRLIQRDYNGVSLYDYYYDRENDANSPNHEVKLTDSGRTVYGGGGITPDVIVSQDTITSAEQPFAKAIGPKFSVVNSVVSDYALSLKGTVRPDFTVQPSWRDTLYQRLTKAGVTVDRQQYDAASRLVDQMLAQKLATIAFGDSTAFRRSIRDDAQLDRAIELLTKGQTQKDLFALAQAQHK